MRHCDATHDPIGQEYGEVQCELEAGHDGPHRVTEEYEGPTIRRTTLEWTEELNPDWKPREPKPGEYWYCAVQTAPANEQFLERVFAEHDEVVKLGDTLNIARISRLSTGAD
jgi:hypothetical protein